MNAVRRVRAYPGQFILLGVLALVAALLVTAVPRIAGRLADEGLRELLGRQPAAVRDLVYDRDLARADGLGGPTIPAEQLERLRRNMPPAVRDTVGTSWFGVQTRPTPVTGGLPAGGPTLSLVLRATSAGQAGVTIVDGRWPAELTGRVGSAVPVTEVVVAEQTAAELGLRIGNRLRLAQAEMGSAQVRTDAEIVGVFRPVDPAAGIWTSLPSPLRATPPPQDGPYLAVALTNDRTLFHMQFAGWRVANSWGYRVDPDRFDSARVAEVIDGIARMNRYVPAGMRLTQGLDLPLRAYVGSLQGARGVLAVVLAGVLAALGGLVVLATLLAVRRRAEEFALVEARGGGRRQLFLRSLAESALVIPVAAGLGWGIGSVLPGRSGPTGSTGLAALVVAAVVVVALPVATVLHRPAAGVRRDLVRLSPSARRLTLEVLLTAVAVLAALLLRRRGLPADGAVDLLLAAVPVLLATAAAVLVLRVYPWPLRLASRLVRRARGVVPFLGLARAGRSVVTGPLVVVVTAIATAAFCGVVATGVDVGRDRAAGLAVPGDVLLTGDGFAPDTVDRLAGQPGVRAVAAMAGVGDQKLRVAVDSAPAGDAPPVLVLLVDGPALARVMERSGVRATLPAALTAARAGAGPVPAVVSPAVAEDLAGPVFAGSGRAFVEAGGRRHEFAVAAVADSFPTVPRNRDRFVILPWQTLPPSPVVRAAPTALLVAASGVDPATLGRIGDDGQRRHFTQGLVTGTAPARATAVTTRTEVRDGLDRGGANGVLYFGFGAGTVGGALLGLLAIAFVVLAGARTRAQALSRLRTMGLSRRQARSLLLFELAPLVTVAVAAGAAVGAALPVVLTSALGLDGFTDGLPVRARFEPALVGAVLVVGVLALLTAVGVEAMINRRQRLGEVLRLGEGS